MGKRAFELSIQTIVVAAIALIVLVVIIVVFGTQISKTAQQYLGISEQAAGEANVTNKCQTMFSSRVCAKDCQTTSNKTMYVPVPGDWADCRAKGMMCCERID